MVDEFDEEEFLEEESVPETKAKPKQKPQPKPAQPEEDTYVAFHVTERRGIINNNTKEVVGEDVFVLLAMLLSKVEKIERATC